MKTESKHRGSETAGAPPATSTSKKMRRRTRELPRWLTGSTELDGIARRRCFMILSVLSGERTVTDVIEEQQLSRQMYYLLETRALNAMLSALVPGSESAHSEAGAASPQRKIAELEEKVKRLEQGKRRGEHLLFLTRQVLGPGPVKIGRGGRRSSKSNRAKSETSSKTGGRAPSARSTSSKTMRASARSRSSSSTATSTDTASTTTSIGSLTPAGADAP